MVVGSDNAVREGHDAGRSGPSPKTIQNLGRYVELFPDVALRTPELHEFLAYLTDKEEHGAIARILGESRTGRPRENVIYAALLVERTKQKRGCTAKDAAEWVAANYRRLSKCARSLTNDHSRYAELLKLGPHWVPAEALMTHAWGSAM